MTLDTSIEFLKGIGSERAKLIANVLDIRTVEDFLHFFPIRYLDKSKVLTKVGASIYMKDISEFSLPTDFVVKIVEAELNNNQDSITN